MSLRPREDVVRECTVRSNKDVGLEANSVPELNSGFDGDTITDDHIILDQDMRANIAIAADTGSREYDHVLPNSSPCSYLDALDVGRRMYVGRIEHDPRLAPRAPLGQRETLAFDRREG